MAKKPLVPAAAIYQLKITLLHIEPPIWRAVEVRGDTNLYRLHRIIQSAMGWEDCHLHQFEVGKTCYGEPEDNMFGPPTQDERAFTVGEVLPKAGRKATYVYDMGDDWTHEVSVEKLVPPVGGRRYPRCTDGARACPPEDCGGTGRYLDLLEALSDPEHEQHEDSKEWLGDDFKPEAFDVKGADLAVARGR